MSRLRFARPVGLAIGLAVIASVLAGGCSFMVDPFTDGFADQPPVLTPSVEGVRAAAVSPTITRSSHAAVEVRAKDGTVTHGPLYFEDTFEDRGSEDGRIAWTGEDLVYPHIGRTTFLLNAVLFPVNAVCTPPWAVMASDGKPGRRALGLKYDARRWVEAVDPESEEEPSVTASAETVN